jgi:two-component system, LytTR family, sensor kinase
VKFEMSQLRKKRYWILPIVCTTLAVFIVYYVAERNVQDLSLKIRTEDMAWGILITNLLGLMVSIASRLLDKVMSWKDAFMARFSVGYLVNLLLILLIIILPTSLISSIKAEILTKIGILLSLFLFIYEILYGWFYSYSYYSHKQIESLKLDRLQLELQFESLKSQISPHFLFNCLNTISSLIYKDTRLAEEFIRRMADTFQYVLKNQKKKFVPLHEELDFVKAYYYLLQVRFQNNLRLEINLPKNILDSPIPPLTLQMLMENSVKHNVISSDTPLLIYLSARDNTHLLVTNSKTKSNGKTSGFQVGLEAIHKRYAFFTQEKIQLTDSDKFTVQLPILKSTQVALA